MITYDPKTATEITLHLEGVASIEGARQFLEAVAKPELRSAKLLCANESRVELNRYALAFGALVSVSTGIAAGLAPAFQSSRSNSGNGSAASSRFYKTMKSAESMIDACESSPGSV